MPQYRISRSAIADINDILRHSQIQFGVNARIRYQTLIKTAFKDLLSSPQRCGSVQRNDVGEGLRSYHLFHSRKRVIHADGLVQKPRHIVLYRQIDDQSIEIVRILHDAMEVRLHLP